MRSWIELPYQRYRGGGADRLTVLRQPLRFTLDVSFERKPQRRGEPQTLQNHQCDAGYDQPDKERKIHVVFRKDGVGVDGGQGRVLGMRAISW